MLIFVCFLNFCQMGSWENKFYDLGLSHFCFSCWKSDLGSWAAAVGFQRLFFFLFGLRSFQECGGTLELLLILSTRFALNVQMFPKQDSESRLVFSILYGKGYCITFCVFWIDFWYELIWRSWDSNLFGIEA